MGDFFQPETDHQEMVRENRDILINIQKMNNKYQKIPQVNNT